MSGRVRQGRVGMELGFGVAVPPMCSSPASTDFDYTNTER